MTAEFQNLARQASQAAALAIAYKSVIDERDYSAMTAPFLVHFAEFARRPDGATSGHHDSRSVGVGLASTETVSAKGAIPSVPSEEPAARLSRSFCPKHKVPKQKWGCPECTRESNRRANKRGGRY
ncbi:MAG: hypothetical protein ACYDAY_03050 [Candidatus Dormibacteria bacterium]